VIGQFLVGVCVEEFRDGILLSRIRRDFQYNVRDCSNPTAACFNLPDTLCNTTTVTFENCSQSTTEYKWTFYDGSGSIMSTSTEFEPTVSYPAYGTYKVQLIASEGPACIDTMIKDITISPTNIVADFSLSVPDCGNSITIKTTNLSTNGTNFWTLTKGGNVINTSTLVAPQFTVNEEGEYTITLIAYHVNGCSDTIQKSITTHLLGDEIIDNYHELCKGESVELNPNGNTSYQYTWSPATYLSPSPDVPNPVSTPDNNVTYLVDILDPVSGCILKDTVTVAIKEDPKLNFTYTNECGSLTVIFANLTTPTQNSYSWDFGDGVGTSTDVNPTYTYTQSGSYWVKIQNTSGCEKIDSQLVKVNYIDIDAVNDSIYLCGQILYL
jgi:PKD repeat protein